MEDDSGLRLLAKLIARRLIREESLAGNHLGERGDNTLAAALEVKEEEDDSSMTSVQQEPRGGGSGEEVTN